MNSICNMRMCDKCREKVLISVKRKWMDNDGSWRETVAPMYCLAHIADVVADAIGRNISLQLTNAGVMGVSDEDNHDEGRSCSGSELHNAGENKVDEVGVHGDVLERIGDGAYVEAEDVVGEAYRG